MSDTPKTDAMMTALLWRTGETLVADVEFADFARQLERDNAALREALQNCAISASGQNWQQIAWIVEGALHRGKEAKP